ncbi:LOW QUALITY PROTEIN: hypothetical protein KUTeg_021246 [Tegillarca granosa]|uniref:Uncharacterized protein n=1 Tax=Tegillarca granosa TaxID=220873 RepID=A0ABQ9EA78_TEGGR|nr:LOW QUALITY PROTEIN: hypothetical protein KUTeg_021246 [Tegillarca granosa]
MKNHQDDNDSSDNDSSEDDNMCPVGSFMKYKHDLNSKCNRLFQRQSILKNSTQWSEASPLGHNKIDDAELISKGKPLSQILQSFLRATSVHLLDSVGKFANRRIMSVTGHKAETSLKTYTGYTGEKIKQSMSDTISQGFRCSSHGSLKSNDAKQQEFFTEKVCVNTCITKDYKENEYSKKDETFINVNDVALFPLTDSQENTLLNEIPEDNFDQIVQEMDFESFNRETSRKKLSTKNNYLFPIWCNNANIMRQIFPDKKVQRQKSCKKKILPIGSHNTTQIGSIHKQTYLSGQIVHVLILNTQTKTNGNLSLKERL